MSKTQEPTMSKERFTNATGAPAGVAKALGLKQPELVD